MDILFYIRRNDAVSHSGQTSIYCTITINGTSCVPFSTGVRILAASWLPKKKTTNDNSADTVRRELNTIENLLRRIKIDFQETEKELTANLIKERFNDIRNSATTRKQKKEVLFLDMAKAYIEKKKNMGASTRTITNNTTFYNNIASYVGATKLSPNMVDFEFVESFTMRFQHEQKNSKNYTNCHIGFVSAVLDYCVLKKVIKHNPLLSMTLQYDSKFDPDGITQHELLILQNAENLIDYEQQAVDIFLFLCGSGVDYCDYVRLTKNDFFSVGNKTMIRKNRKKMIKYNTTTVNVANVILKDCAIKILEKYGADNLPKIANSQNVNRTLQRVGKRLGIQTHLTTKRGRKTFTNISVNIEMHTDEQAAYQLGHSSTKQLKHYRAYKDDILKNLF